MSQSHHIDGAAMVKVGNLLGMHDVRRVELKEFGPLYEIAGWADGGSVRVNVIKLSGDDRSIPVDWEYKLFLSRWNRRFEQIVQDGKVVSCVRSNFDDDGNLKDQTQVQPIKFQAFAYRVWRARALFKASVQLPCLDDVS